MNIKSIDPGLGEVNRVCCFCDNPAIGYETWDNCGGCVCKDHASEQLLSMEPGKEFDERGSMLSWEFLKKTGNLNPIYRCLFQEDPSKVKSSVKRDLDLWTIDECANVLMVHREGIHKLIKNGYLLTKESNGIVYIQKKSFDYYIEQYIKWGILLPLVWRQKK